MTLLYFMTEGSQSSLFYDFDKGEAFSMKRHQRIKGEVVSNGSIKYAAAR